MIAAVRSWSSWVASHRRELGLFSGLAALAALVFLLRWEVLIQFPYPPSNDVGGDLYSAQQWLGNPIPGLWIALQPPLYYWLVVIPAVHFFGPFTGPQVYMSLVPALLVFPGYALCRETGARTVSSAIGAFGFAMATTLSLMVSWNGAYNALGILFLTAFATFLLRSVKAGRARDAIAAGAFLALVAGTHELTFLVGAIAFIATAVMCLALTDGRRATLRTAAIILATTVVCFLPLVPIYWSTATDTANSGVGGYQSQLVWAFTVFPTFAWGFQGPDRSFLALVDVAVGTLGLVILWSGRSTRHSAIVLSSIWIAGLAITLASASNAVRGLYYLTLPATLVVPSFFEYLLVLPRSASPTPLEAAPAYETRTRRTHSGWAMHGKPRGSVVATLVVVSLLAFTYLNVAFSVQNLRDSTRYYLSLSSDSVAALRWLGSHTNQSDRIMDVTGVQPWIWGLSHRLAYAPTPLGLESTTASLASGQLADYVWLGTHLAGNSRLTIADNAPSRLGVPNVFVNVPGYWQEMVSSQSDLISFHLRHGPSAVSESLASANLMATNSSILPSGDVRTSYSYWWNHQQFGVNETILLMESAVSIQWAGWNATVTDSTVWLGLPPPGSQFVDVSSETNVNLTPLLENRYRLVGTPFTMSMSGGTFHQAVMPRGWASVWCNTTGAITIDFSGLPPEHSVAPFAEDTSSLIHGLGIDFFLSNPSSDDTTFLRLVQQAISGAAVKPVFQAGSVYVFALTFA